MAMGRCTSWVCQLLLKVPEALKWMRCRGDRCSGRTQSRSQTSAESEIVATVEQNTGDIEADGVRNGGVEIGALNKFPFSELVALLQIAVAAATAALGTVSMDLVSCDKWWVPGLLFSSVAVAVAALASWIVNKHLISNFKV